MAIRPLQDGDLEPFIDELWVPALGEMEEMSYYSLSDDVRAVGLSHRRDILEDPDSATFVAVRDNELTGFATAEIQTPPPVFRQARECYISELFVRERDRRQGIGTGLVERIDSWARAQDCEYLTLDVDRVNEGAIALYEELGYTTQRYTMWQPID